MKNLFKFVAIVTVISITSCKSIRWSVRDASTLNVTKSGVFTKPKVADLKIENGKVTGAASGNIKEKNVESIKGEALQNALREAQADILVEPIYEVERDGKIISARVTGFPAKVTSFKDITPDDTLAFATASKFYIRPANLNSTDAASQAATADKLATEKRKKVMRSVGIGLGIGIPVILGLGIGLGIGGDL